MNRFGLLLGEDSDEEINEPGDLPRNKDAQPSKDNKAAAKNNNNAKGGKGPVAKPAAGAKAPVKDQAAGQKGGRADDTRRGVDFFDSGEKNMRGGRGGRGRGGPGRGAAAGRNERQSRGQRFKQDKAQGHKEGHGAANWGSDRDVIQATGEEIDDAAAAAPAAAAASEGAAAAPAEGAAEEAEAVEEEQDNEITLEEYLKRQAGAKPAFELPKQRKAGEGDNSAAKDVKHKEALNENGDDTASGERKAQRSNQLQFLDIEFRSGPRGGREDRPFRGEGGRGRGRGGEQRGRGGRGRGGEQRGRGGDRGRGVGRGGNRGGRQVVLREEDFPSLK